MTAALLSSSFARGYLDVHLTARTVREPATRGGTWIQFINARIRLFHRGNAFYPRTDLFKLIRRSHPFESMISRESIFFFEGLVENNKYIGVGED